MVSLSTIQVQLQETAVPLIMSCQSISSENERQSNMAKGDIARMNKNPHFGGRGCHRESAMVLFERAMVVFYRLSIVTISSHSTAIWRQMSPTLKSIWGGSLRVKIWGGRGDRCKPNFHTIWDGWGAVVCQNSCRYLMSFEHNVRIWQTDIETENGRITCRNNRLAAMMLKSHRITIDEWHCARPSSNCHCQQGFKNDCRLPDRIDCQTKVPVRHMHPYWATVLPQVVFCRRRHTHAHERRKQFRWLHDGHH